MRKIIILFLLALFLFLCCTKNKESPYTVGIFQFTDAPTLNDVRKGIIRAFEDNGLRDGNTIRLIQRNAKGRIPEVHRIAQEFVEEKVNMIVALSTPCLQAALIATHEIPIIFSSVANPYLAGAGKSADNHRSNVSGVSSRGPIKESLAFIRKILPQAKRLGTLWTPVELNSEYYLELAREVARELDFEIVAVSIANGSEVLHSTQVLINQKIDAMYQISDNTNNAAFADIGNVAAENTVPLFGGFLLSTHSGACAALGWDFFEMGLKAGEIAIRVKNGESPAGIPIQYMSKLRMSINLNAAKKQRITFPDQVLKEAHEVLEEEEEEEEKVK